MKIKINGESKDITKTALTVTDLLQDQNVNMPEMVTVELNGEIIDRDAFSATSINDGDEVEFLYFMGGGCY